MSLPATDDFNRADGALGATWTSQGAPPTIVSNVAVPDGGGFGYAYDAVNTYANDQYSQAVLGTGITGTTVYAGVTVRASGTGGSRNNYFLVADGTDATIYKSVSGSVTLLQTISGGGSLNGGVLYRLTVEGQSPATLKAYRSTDTTAANLAQIGTNQTDPDLASGSAGIGGFNAGVAKIDDWEGGNMGGGAATAVPVFMNQYRQRWN